MTARQQWAAVGGVVAALAIALFAATRIFHDDLFPLSVGSRAPDFRARTVDGPPRTKGIADYKGQVVLLNIWGTWCPPCVKEMPSMEALHRKLGPRGLKVVAVAIDEPGGEASIRQFRDEYQLSFEILFDPTGQIKRTFQTTGVPETFVIDAEGVIRKKRIGPERWDSPSNIALFETLLPSATPDAAPGRDAPAAVPVPTRP